MPSDINSNTRYNYIFIKNPFKNMVADWAKTQNNMFL